MFHIFCIFCLWTYYTYFAHFTYFAYFAYRTIKFAYFAFLKISHICIVCAYHVYFTHYNGHNASMQDTNYPTTKAQGNHVILYIFCIFCIFLNNKFPPQTGQINVSLPSYTSTVNQHENCMSFLCPPYWDGCNWFQWVPLGRYWALFNMRRESADFPGASCE